MNEPPLDVWVIISKDGWIFHAHCTCTAGLGESCSHISALLFYLEFVASQRVKESVTEQECKWNVRKAVKKVAMNSISQIDFETTKAKFREMDKCDSECEVKEKKMRRQMPVAPPTPAERTSLFEKLAAASLNFTAPIAIYSVSDFYEPRKSDVYPPCLRELFSEEYLTKSIEELREIAVNLYLDITQAQCDKLEEGTRLQSKSKLWFLIRAGRITASLFKAVCRTSLERPSLSLLNQMCYPERFKFVSKAMRWGCDHENNAREM